MDQNRTSARTRAAALLVIYLLLCVAPARLVETQALWFRSPARVFARCSAACSIFDVTDSCSRRGPRARVPSVGLATERLQRTRMRLEVRVRSLSLLEKQE